MLNIPYIKLINAVADACNEIQNSPDDSIQDIFNESLKSWETGLIMNSNFYIDQMDYNSVKGTS